MKYFLGAAALLAATVSADLCADGSTDDNGNYYCQEVKAISYTGVGGAGSYNKVTSMDSGSGTCGSSASGYSGSLAPLDQEVSLHFRGPLNLKQFAFYSPSASSKRSVGRKSAHERRHVHNHMHAHQHQEKRALGDIVTATIDGVVETWANDWSGVATSAPAAASAPAATTTKAAGLNLNLNLGAALNLGGSSGLDASASASASVSVSGGAWGRQAYYNAEQAHADGLVFLNHEGGSGSGVFDYVFGNSLSYASSNGASCAASPQTLADTTLASSTEVVIMTDNKCSGDDCGFYRDGTVAYHGFDGPSKAFFFEFEMPDSGETAASEYDPVNMPAIWMLNALIPRTLQYGQADCSCWTSGCGEFDIFEVLAPGDTRCKSTLHGNIAGGDSDYFARPTNGTIKAALVLYEDNIHIKVLDDSTTFGASMDANTISNIASTSLEQSLINLVSVFKLSG